MTPPHHTRREFLTGAATAIAGVALAGCAEEPDDTGEVDCPEITIGQNHGHVLEIPLSDIEAGDTKTYTLEGTHTHTLEIDELVFEKLAAGDEHTLPTSTEDGHSHLVTVRLDPTCLPDG